MCQPLVTNQAIKPCMFKRNWTAGLERNVVIFAPATTPTRDVMEYNCTSLWTVKPLEVNNDIVHWKCTLLLDGIYVIFSLCYRWNCFWLRRRRKRWRAVRGFDSRLFWRRLFLAGSRGWYGLGPRVRTCRGCGWGRRGLELGWCWRSYFRELNRHLLVSLVGFGHVEGSFRCGMRKGLWCKTVTCQKCIAISNTVICRDLIRVFRPPLFCSQVEGRKSSIYQTDCGQRVLH